MNSEYTQKRNEKMSSGAQTKEEIVQELIKLRRKRVLLLENLLKRINKLESRFNFFESTLAKQEKRTNSDIVERLNELESKVRSFESLNIEQDSMGYKRIPRYERLLERLNNLWTEQEKIKELKRLEQQANTRKDSLHSNPYVPPERYPVIQSSYDEETDDEMESLEDLAPEPAWEQDD